MSLKFDAGRVRKNVNQASTADLLDRVTAYRAGLEPEALVIIEEELNQRGVTQEFIDQQMRQREQEGFLAADGTSIRCGRCRRPAVSWKWGWQKVFFVVPLFPRRIYLCADHA